MKNDIVETKVDPTEEKPEGAEYSSNRKAVKQIEYIGVWMKEKCGNQPILCIHPDYIADIQPFLDILKDKIIKASIQIEEKPLITRLNLRGLRGTVLKLLEQVAQS